jgi:hypothetical protein
MYRLAFDTLQLLADRTKELGEVNKASMAYIHTSDTNEVAFSCSSSSNPVFDVLRMQPVRLISASNDRISV